MHCGPLTLPVGAAYRPTYMESKVSPSSACTIACAADTHLEPSAIELERSSTTSIAAGNGCAEYVAVPQPANEPPPPVPPPPVPPPPLSPRPRVLVEHESSAAHASRKI